jgi:trans-AT polyketide synthase/acyltransferase/oxidoreductase domain-containing protein
MLNPLRSSATDSSCLETFATDPVPALCAEGFGSASFRSDFGVRYAYVTGAMYKGIASRQLVTAMGRAGLMGFFGAGGLDLSRLEAELRGIQADLGSAHAYGMNLLANPERPQMEEQTVDLYLRHGVRNIEAAAFTQMTPAIVRYRLDGLHVRQDGAVIAPNRIIAKVSRPEVASAFMQPAPEAIVKRLLAAGKITPAQAELSNRIPVARDICVEADSGGHTDRGVASVLVPTMRRLRDEMMSRYRYADALRIGAAGGIGTPEAVAAMFLLGADFIVTGSINQCTVESGTSAAVKDMLQDMGIQDTAYAPAGDMFEIGAKVQVLRRGVFFPTRANKLYEVYQRCRALEQIDDVTRKQLEEKVFRRSFDEVWQDTRRHYAERAPDKLREAEADPKKKMALVFKSYFAQSTRFALEGQEDRRVDYQVHCGPALGAFNAFVKGTELESWRNRHVADLADRLMRGAARYLQENFSRFGLRPAELLLRHGPSAA